MVGMHMADLIGVEDFEQRIKPNLDRCFAGEDVTDTDWFTGIPGRQYLAVSFRLYARTRIGNASGAAQPPATQPDVPAGTTPGDATPAAPGMSSPDASSTAPMTA